MGRSDRIDDQVGTVAGVTATRDSAHALSGGGHADQVRQYYDANAAAFERLGHGGASIHRAVWGPGVVHRTAAIHFVDDHLLDLLATSAESADRPTVVDLGCGVGASLLYLARHRDIDGEGITISGRQAVRAAELIAESGAAARVRCREGSYLALPDDLAGRAHLAFSIEAFLHSPDADGYFAEAARTLRQDGALVICDDFLTPAGAAAESAAESPGPGNRGAGWLSTFRTGWRVGSLLTVDQVQAAAARHGLDLVADLDLTPYLELRRPRDRFITALVTMGRPLRLRGEYWQSLVGGDALQRALTGGLLSYRVLELRPHATRH